MALVVSPHPNVLVADPTLSLKRALVNFEDILTDEQKRQYQISPTKPDAASVIAFVAQIDANNSAKTRRCVAPRLCTFLKATQQFSGVVDTFISSNPTIAALIWGGVKTALLTASNVASYFEKVTNMIMGIGRSCPTYQQFGQLYPGCVDLQRALCDYYAIVVRLCIKIIQVSRRTALTQTLSPIFHPFESEFKTILDDLEQAVKNITLQISFASNQAVQEAKKLLECESKENAKHWRSALDFQKATKIEHTEAQNLRGRKTRREAAKLKTCVRDNLSSINYVKPWSQAMQERVPDTAVWLQQEYVFGQWKNDGDTAILWCSGKMGVGKTVLVSNVVAQLHASRKPNDIISYYFCRADHDASLSARNIFGSLARQMLDVQIEHAEDDNLQGLHKNSQDLDTANVVDFLLSRLEIDKTYYLILDGLDECDIDEVRTVALSMARICDQRVKEFKILCAGRPELEKQLFRVIRPKYRILVTEEKVESDMDQYIATILGRCLQEEQLKLRDPKHIVKISEALREGSEGMFLWTRLFIEELCAQGNDNDILEALKHLPRGLSEVFDRKLGRVRDQIGAKEAIKMLQSCGVAKRPLTVKEYQEALSLSRGQKFLDRGKLPNDMDRIISDCCGLTFVDEEEDTVHYVHHSVKQHLFATNRPHSAEFDVASVDRDLGFLCMTYLDFTDFKRQLTKVKEGSNTPIQPVQLGILPVARLNNTSIRIAQCLLRHRRQLRYLNAQELERKTQEVLGDAESSRLELELHKREVQFLGYARTYWIDHLTELDADTDDKMWRLFCRCVEGNDILAYRPWESEQHAHGDRKDIPKVVQWLLAHRHYALLLYQVRHQSHSLTEYVKQEILHNAAIHDRHRVTEIIMQLGNNTSETLNHGLFYAAREGCIDSLASLLRAGADVNSRMGDQTVLQAAAGGGHLEVVKRLLAAKANVNAAAANYSVNGRTALQAAAGGGHLEVVERLLAAKADVNAAAASRNNGRTALQAAAGGGHLEVVERLLAAKADVNAAAADSDDDGRTALQAAAGGGHLEVVERLLAAKADVNAAASRNNGRTALQAAAGGGHLEVVERLLAAKADVNAAAASRNNGRTALQAAAGGGHLEVVERLLAAKADVNAAAADSDDDGRTALQAAAGGGHLEVVERLLAAKADVNAAAAEFVGRTALQAAAGGGHLEVVERLLAAKADVNAAASRNNGRTALQAAAGGGHLEVVERLLAAKADVNVAAADYNGRTALQAAAGGGHLEVVERLLAAKADVNAAASRNNGRTALQAAAGGGHLEVVERLLAAKADVNAAAAEDSGRTALQAAAGGGHLEVVERLLAAKADVNAAVANYSINGRTALQAAAGGGHLEVVERLLAAKADVNATASYGNGCTALQAAAGGGHLEVVERLLAAKADVNTAAAGRTALQAAAGGGHLEVVERLLAAKADVNVAAAEFVGRTALQAAAGGGHLEVVERLLAAKADVNTAAAGDNGRTTLQAAAGGGHLQVVERLLAAKAYVNAAAGYNNGRTALQAAAGGGHLEVVERLLAAKADVNAAVASYSINGRTALQAAAGGGHLEVVERLLAAKADVNAAAAEDSGRTALQAAAGGGHLKVVERLKQAGAWK